jgi:hypothetical protein
MPRLPDTRIALSGGGGDGGQRPSLNPIGTLGAMMQIKEQQLQYQQRQREAEEAQRKQELALRDQQDEDEVRAVIAQHDRPDDALDYLQKSGRYTPAVGRFAKELHSQRTGELQQASAMLTAQEQVLGRASAMLASVTDQASLDNIRPALIKLTEPKYGAGVRDLIPTTFDKAKITQLVRAAETRTNQITEDNNRITRQMNAHNTGYTKERVDPATGEKLPPMWSRTGLQTLQEYQTNMARDLAAAPTKEVYDTYLSQYYANGTPKEVWEKFPTWSDADNGKSARAKSAELGMSLQQQVGADVTSTRAQTAQTQAETARLRAQTAAAEAAGGGGGRITRKQEIDIDKDHDKVNEDIEDWVRKTYLEENRNARIFTKDPKTGKDIETARPDFTLNLLSQGTQREFVRKRIQNENNRRRAKGYPPLQDAAQQAAAKGDAAGYEKIRGIYNSLTQIDNLSPGIVPVFEQLVPPPQAGAKTQGPASRVNPPAATAAQLRAQADLVELGEQFDAEKDPAKKLVLKKKIDELLKLR